MGLTIYSPNKSIDMSASGFMRLRRDIAYIYSSQLGKHYETLTSYYTTDDYKKFHAKILELIKPKDIWLLDFLYASDMEGKLTYGKCRKLLELIGNYNKGCYGYIGLPNCATMSDFKNLLDDCVLNKRQLYWR